MKENRDQFHIQSIKELIKNIGRHMYDDDDRKKESVATTIHSFLGIFLPDKFGFCGGGGC